MCTPGSLSTAANTSSFSPWRNKMACRDSDLLVSVLFRLSLVSLHGNDDVDGLCGLLVASLFINGVV